MNSAAPKHANRLAREKSPYLLQHQHNPVDWFAWGEEAFSKARAENKPIFLSIGYSTCHWCHVMERESFENVPTAAILNAHFVVFGAIAEAQKGGHDDVPIHQGPQVDELVPANLRHVLARRLG